MAPTHVQILEVFALHEPPLSRPSATLSPPGGERAGRGVPIWFMVPVHAEKRKGALHEPPLSRPSATLSPPCGERAGRGVPIWFMVPVHAEKRKGLPMNRVGRDSVEP